MAWPDDYQAWFDLGNEIRDAAVRIVETVEIKYSRPNGLNDPPIYAAALLFRTLRSCRAAFTLTHGGDLVEASLIARSCVENVLWLRGLQQRGLEFVQDILGDGQRAEGSLAELILKMPSVAFDAEVQQLAVDQIKAKTKVRIEVGAITSSEAASMDYAVFRMISNSYAHPSMRSLDCHVNRSPTTGAYELAMEPDATPNDLLWTLFVAGGAALTATGLFLETFHAEEQDRFTGLGHGKALYDLSKRLKALGREEGLSGPEDNAPAPDDHANAAAPPTR